MNIDTITYRGYTARVEFDAEDRIFFGRVLGVRVIISFHCKDQSELQASLEASIDDYLADCISRGINPEKPESGNNYAENTL